MTPTRATLPDEVKATVLFGSHARGEADEHSDLDVWVVVDDVELDRLLEIRNSCAESLSTVPDSVTVHTSALARSMARSGSLFLWHVKLEGEILHDPDGVIAELLAGLEAFRGYAEELQLYEGILENVRRALELRGGLNEFELHLLYVVLRNAAILVTYADGSVEFGRRTPIDAVAARHSELVVDGELADDLCAWHLTYSRGIRRSPLPMADECKVYVDRIEQYLLAARELVLCEN